MYSLSNGKKQFISDRSPNFSLIHKRTILKVVEPRVQLSSKTDLREPDFDLSDDSESNKDTDKMPLHMSW